MELCWKWRKVVNSYEEVRSQITGSEIMNLSGSLEDTVAEILLQPNQHCVATDAGAQGDGQRGGLGGEHGERGGQHSEGHRKRDGRLRQESKRYGGGGGGGQHGGRGGPTEQSVSERSSPEPAVTPAPPDYRYAPPISSPRRPEAEQVEDSLLQGGGPASSNSLNDDQLFLEIGCHFSTEEEAITKLEDWSYQNKISIVKATRIKEKIVNGKFQGAIRIFKCPHGIERKSKSKGIRCKQSVNFTGCKFSIRITEKEDKSWLVTGFNSEHSGYETSQQNFFIHQNNRKLSPDDRQFLIDMMKGNASNPNMAAALSQRTGRTYSYQDVANFVNRISAEEVVDPLEEHLSAIRSAGGTVQYKKKEGTNDVTCLFVQTASMKAQLFEEKPNTFQVDTTFGTNRENFKLWIPVFKSETTGQWEIGCLLFIETEIKTNIEHGVRMFRDSLPYQLTSSFFFADKDFDYIHVSV